MSPAPQILGPPTGVSPNRTWTAKCPGCGVIAVLDEDQFHGRVSLDCPRCPYHETHDLSGARPQDGGG